MLGTRGHTFVEPVPAQGWLFLTRLARMTTRRVSRSTATTDQNNSFIFAPGVNDRVYRPTGVRYTAREGGPVPATSAFDVHTQSRGQSVAKPSRATRPLPKLRYVRKCRRAAPGGGRCAKSGRGVRVSLVMVYGKLLDDDPDR